MKIEASKSAYQAATERRQSPPHEAAAGEPEAGADRAALPAVRPEDRPRRQPRGGYAPLVAQLIATKLEMPQTRERRRASPDTAVSAYSGTAAGPRTMPSRLVRSV